MKIVLFHPVLLPPKDYGGVERVVLWLSQALAEIGHEVWVAALRGSVLPEQVKLLPVSEKERALEAVLPRIPGDTECLHLMAPPPREIWEKIPIPWLLTVHGNGKAQEVFPKNSIFLSKDHARRHGAEKFIYNGVNPDEYVFRGDGKTDSYLFLSKTSWSVKNLRGAMRLSGQADVKLKIAGGRRPWMARLRARVSPRFDWVGPVNGLRKAALLASSKALLFPVTWPEPFGLVVVEALISGTPVLASNSGSLPELVSPDVGRILKSEQEWIAALRERDLPFRPERCREYALENFHFRKMARAYEKAYDAVVRGQELHSKFPTAPGRES